MIASLSMYDWPGQSGHWDTLWDHVRDALRARDIAAPAKLSRGGRLWDHWERADLVLGQTCGMPFRTRLASRVHLLGTLDHGLTGCPAGYYNSVIIAHRDASGDVGDFEDRTLAYNGIDSESGWAAIQNHAASHGFRFRRKLHTGAHGESARAVALGRADIAAIDAETWRLVQFYMPDIAAALRVLARTAPTPGLPLITAAAHDPAPIFDAVQDALRATPAKVLDALHIRGLVRVPASAYLAVANPPALSQDVPAA